VTVQEDRAGDQESEGAARRATAYITLERAATDTGWRLVTFSLGPTL
jgi:hypothetical protein